MRNVIEIEALSRRFGRQQALASISLTIPEGCVFGLVGENGAGKTTLLKHILGLYRPQRGWVRVFGLAPADRPVEVLSQLGYLSEDRLLPEWMTVEEVTRYSAAFYPQWDHGYVRELMATFELLPAQKIVKLSRGQRARVGLMLALAHRPSLLLLDEPSSGLDPLVRRDILGAIIRSVADEGRTVVFSSHLLDEVQRVSDRLAMLDAGRVVMEGPLDELLASHQRITIRFAAHQSQPPALDGALQLVGGGREWTAICNGKGPAVEDQVRKLGGDIVERRPLTLEEIFLAHSEQPSRRLV